MIFGKDNTHRVDEHEHRLSLLQADYKALMGRYSGVVKEIASIKARLTDLEEETLEAQYADDDSETQTEA